MDIKIALVGIGGYGGFYLNHLLQKSLEGARLVAAVDPYPERCPQLDLLKEAGIPLYADLETFYRQGSADLTIIVAPIHLHAPYTCLALVHGSNVLCEKPLCASLEDARQMLAAEKQTGKFVAVGYQWSFSDAVLALKGDILAGRFGRPRRMKCMVLWPRMRSYYQRNDWAGRIKSTEGAWVLDSPVNNAAAHYLHNMLFLLGDSLSSSAQPLSVQAELYRANPIENYDAAALRVTTAKGTDLLFLTAHSVNEEKGPLSFFEFEDAVIEYAHETQEFRARFKSGITRYYGSPEATGANKLWQSLDCLRSGAAPVCGIRTAIPHLLCMLGAQTAPITTFPSDLVRTEDLGGDSLTWVEGLGEVFSQSYETGCLPSESHAAPWVYPAAACDLQKIATGLSEQVAS